MDDQTFAEAVREWWPVILFCLGLIVYAVRLDGKVNHHTAVQKEIHDKADDQAKALSRVEGKVDGLVALLAGIRPGGRRWTDSEGRIHDEGGG